MIRFIMLTCLTIFGIGTFAATDEHSAKDFSLVEEKKLYFPVFGKSTERPLHKADNELIYTGILPVAKDPIAIRYDNFKDMPSCPKLSFDQNGDGIYELSIEHFRLKVDDKNGDTNCAYKTFLNMNYGPEKEFQQWRKARVLLYLSIDENGIVSESFRYSLGLTLASKININNVEYDIVLQDMNGNALIDQSIDYWTLRRSNNNHRIDHKEVRCLNDYVWVDGVAYKANLANTYPTSLTVQAFEPGISEEEDYIRRDRYRADRVAPKADNPLLFSHNPHEAIVKAKLSGKPYFIDFETSWCAPCKAMDSHVYTAKAVVKAAQGIICIKVDGDEDKDLTSIMNVKSYPTGILFDEKGNEVKRFTGYQSVEEMVLFFKGIN